MTKGKTKKGNASPIRKAYVAFMLGCLCPSTVALAFEGRMDPEDAELLIGEYNSHVAKYAEVLRNGKFEPYDFCDSYPSIQVEHGGKKLQFKSFGEYADWLDATDDDVISSTHWLGQYARSIKDVFGGFGVKLPSANMIEQAFVSRKGYARVCRALGEAFRAAEARDLLTSSLYELMEGFHKSFVRSHGLKDFVGIVDDDVLVKRIMDTLPLCIADESSAGAVFASLLPIILASGIDYDPRDLFRYRMTEGGMHLLDLANICDNSGASLNGEQLGKALREILEKYPERLQPDISGDKHVLEVIRDNAGDIADALVNNTYEAEKCIIVPNIFLFV